MRSIGTGGVTIVMIITFIFASWFGGNGRRHTTLVGTRIEQRTVKCVSGDRCPPLRIEVRTEYVPRKP